MLKMNNIIRSFNRFGDMQQFSMVKDCHPYNPYKITCLVGMGTPGGVLTWMDLVGRYSLAVRVSAELVVE
jgi:hypothetical protein